MSELMSALDALAAEDLNGRADGAVRDRVVGLVALQNRAVVRRAGGATSTMWPPTGADGELASRGEGVVLLHTTVHHGSRVQRDPGGRCRIRSAGGWLVQAFGHG